MRKILIYASSRSFRIEEPLAHAGYSVIHIPENYGKLLKFLKFIEVTRKERPHLFLIDSIGLMCISAYCISLVFRIPFSVRLRANIWDVYEEQKLYLRFPERVYRCIMLSMCEIILRKAHRVFPVSTALAELCERKGVSKNKIRILYYPIDCTKFSPHVKGGDRIELLSVTNLSFKAKFGALIEVLPIIDSVLTDYTNLYYTIVGDGLFSHVLEEEITKMKNADRVSYVGHQEKIEDFFGKSDIFLHFSRLDGFPGAVVEAMACELPVVANRYEAMMEQIEDGVTGVLVDESTLKDALELLITHKDLRTAMGKAARQTIKKKFNRDCIAQTYTREIEAMMKEIKY
ncbi:MAG: glycosyltransferase family 4 protein [Theionarchaea archaeon]|nr:glycosyltransferase family 4 protein [Theionarchaea archaeon]